MMFYSKASTFERIRTFFCNAKLIAHLQCAGYEMPLSDQDEKWFGSLMKEICERRLEKDSDGW